MTHLFDLVWCLLSGDKFHTFILRFWVFSFNVRVFFPADVSGADVRTEILYGGDMKQSLLKESELAALESLLKHTHGCDYYNYDGCEL